MDRSKSVALVLLALLSSAMIQGEVKDSQTSKTSPKVLPKASQSVIPKKKSESGGEKPTAPSKADATKGPAAGQVPAEPKKSENPVSSAPSVENPDAAPGPDASKVSKADGVGAMGYVEPQGKVLCLYPLGQISAVVQQMHVKEGDRVEKGQVLVTLSDFSIRQIEYTIANKELDLAKEFYRLEKGQMDRSEKLNKSLSISEKEMENQRYKVEKSKLDVAIAQEKVRLCEVKLAQAQVCAPTDGTILHLYSQVGERIGEHGLLLMANLSEIEIIAEVHETDISRVYIGQKVQIGLPNQSDIPMIGRVYYKGNMVGPNTVRDINPKGTQDMRVVQVRIKLTPEDCKNLENSLKMYVDVRFFTDSENDGVATSPQPISIQPRVV